MSAITDVLARIDNSLEQHNIDSSICMQRVICTYVNEAQRNMQTGEANSLDQFIYAITKYVFFDLFFYNFLFLATLYSRICLTERQ